ncbi:MAG: response regulator [Candidatus Binataceae bacterium]|nr:response regulator [Candidatus Binataceae bacterium]
MAWPILTIKLTSEHDIVAARQRARQIAEQIGFEAQDQTRIATAVSEISRNAVKYAGGGSLEFLIEGLTVPQLLVVRISDEGPGIRDLQKVLRGEYDSPGGMGMGIIGTRRLMDGFTIEPGAVRGTVVTLKKFIARDRLYDARSITKIGAELARRKPRDLVEEIQLQNQELMRAMSELQKRQEQLTQVNRELDDTNRGVVALYAELDERADHLRRADHLKSRFLSNMSHEFRTPLNSIGALCALLLENVDGELNSEQRTQVGFIQKAADGLSELVNDLLDIAKVEAGKLMVRPIEFEVALLFGALRGMLKPLLVSESVRLIFEEPDDFLTMYTDEPKVSQILRNFLSNALKFTERGEVRIKAEKTADGRAVVFAVSDTGIGIAPEDQERIFEEFSQLDNPIQKQVRGTGLGLPLTRRLAALLGGSVSVRSQAGVGSTFYAVIPTVYEDRKHSARDSRDPGAQDGSPVLVVEDNPEDVYLCLKALQNTGFFPIPVNNLGDARRALIENTPVAIVLDVLLRGEDSWAFLAELKRDSRTSGIPVIMVSTVEDERKGLALGADAYGMKPVDRDWLVGEIRRLTGRHTRRRLLLIDDDEVSRYVVKHSLGFYEFDILEASGGVEGLERARSDRPDAILLDLMMPDMDGSQVLDALKSDPGTAEIPVVMITSHPLSGLDDQLNLKSRVVAIVSKNPVSRDQFGEIVRDILEGPNTP